MKKVLLTLVLALSVLGASAQMYGLGTSAEKQQGSSSFEALKDQRYVKFAIEYVSIHGMTEKDYAVYEPAWPKDKIDIVGQFKQSLSDELDGALIFGNQPEAKYTIKAVVNTVNKSGDYNCDMVLLDANGNEVGRMTGIKASGGHFGTKDNLIGDGAEHTGKKFGKILRKLLKSSR